MSELAKLKFYGGFCELKRLRQALGLTQAQAAAKIGITGAYYAQLEYGGYYSHKKLKIIHQFLRQYLKQADLDFNSLKLMRLRADLTQTQAAHRLNISQSLYGFIERGEYSSPSLIQRAYDLFQEIINDL